MELETRRKIYELIRKSPGIHFREIERRLNIAIGNLQYHLYYLEKENLIRSERDGEYIRYYPKDCMLDEIDRKIISFLRRRTARRILIYLLTNPNANNKEIAQGIGLSPSTISWHLNKLLEAKIVERKKEGRESFFRVKDLERVARLLITYKESFLDRLVEGFVEVWERAELD